MRPGWGKREYAALAAVGSIALLAVWGGVSYSRTASVTAATASVAPLAGETGAMEFSARGEDAAPAPSPTPAGPYKVHVIGAVKRPGVYSLEPGSRIIDAIKAAGGARADARRDILNESLMVQDADQIYIVSRTETAAKAAPLPAAPGSSPGRRAPSVSSPPPTYGVAPIILPRPVLVHSTPVRLSPLSPVPVEPPRGRILGRPEPIAPPATPAATAVAIATEAPSSVSAEAGPEEPVVTAAVAASNASPARFKNPGDGVVNLNTASAEELTRLPGVGPSTAQKILDYRQEIGSFTEAAQLLQVKGIGEKKFAKMKPFVTVR